MFELYCNGKPTKLLFMSEANAWLWVNAHGDSGAAYSIRPYAKETGGERK